MRLLSVNVGRPREVEWRGQTFRTSVYKTPVDGRVELRPHNLAGDEQANLDAHGGEDKAVYAYPVELYAWWCARLEVDHLPWGALGENLTVAGADDADVFIGDRYRIGTAELMVTQPRMPCRKLAVRLDRDDAESLFVTSGRSGYYLSVGQSGSLGAGDDMELLERDAGTVSVAEVFRLQTTEAPDPQALVAASEAAGLPRDLRRKLRARAERAGGVSAG